MSKATTPPLNDRNSDEAYRKRLWAEYIELSKPPTKLLAPIPAWATDYLCRCTPAEVAIETLGRIPRLQAALAGITAYTPGKWLLEQELAQRKPNRPPDNDLYPHPSGHSPDQSWTPPAPGEKPLEDVYLAAGRENLRGLCFSGGGIRSATFCLGVLQAFAEHDKLESFDYLSTVSGGGYIHQWLASWIRNEPDRIARVQKLLKPLPCPGSGPRAPEQITWLRRYSTYLTPQRGVFSADTWTMLSTWFRNTFLNQIVLFSFLILCLLAARFVTYLFLFYWRGPIVIRPQCVSLAIFVIFCIAVAFIFRRLWRALASQSEDSSPSHPNSKALNNTQVLGYIVLPSFLLALSVALGAMGAVRLPALYKDVPLSLSCALVFYTALTFAITFGGKAPQAYQELTGKPAWRFNIPIAISALTCVLAAGSLVWFTYNVPAPAPPKSTCVGSAPAPKLVEVPADVIARVACLSQMCSSSPLPCCQVPLPQKTYPSRSSRLYTNADQVADFFTRHMQKTLHLVTPQAVFAVFAPIVFLAIQFFTLRLQLGLIGRFYTEERREWLARLGGWSALSSILWIVFSGIGVFGPIVFYWLFTSTTFHRVEGILGALAVHAVTLFSGASSKTTGRPKPSSFFGYSPLDLVGMIGAPICILILLVLCSGLIDISIDSIWPHYWQLTFLILGVVMVFLVFGWRVDVNDFSMHGFYRNRLARCYLGGTNPRRSPDPFTGFDEHAEASTMTGMRLSELLPKKFGGTDTLEGEALTDRNAYNGPFPIFCCTVNLTFGEDLAWQERKGASFALTPLYSGYHVGWTAANVEDTGTTFNGFVPTADYAYEHKGIHLATVTAISGAALSPNMGYNSQPALAFLMTLFNVRLGWWLANPRKPAVWPAKRLKPTPLFGIWSLLSELFGKTSDTSNYVSLSDGGHFENLGLYELVRRRCRFIVICDAGTDDGPRFEDIGLAIAKCRTDFGAEIELNLKDFMPNPDGKGYNEGCATTHSVRGHIHYPAPPGAEPSDPRFSGEVIYLKTAITGKEPVDILHHRLAYPDFPQDTTLNQWFSESQFESYRRLGQLTGEEAIPFL